MKEHTWQEYCNRVHRLEKRVTILEQEPFINKPCISQGVCREAKVLDKIKAEIEKQEKWLLQAGYNQYNVDIAFHSIKAIMSTLEEISGKQKEDLT